MCNQYGVIFDMDGVLADTGPIHFESWVKMSNEIGIKFTREFFEKTFGQQSITITRRLVGPNIKSELIEKWAELKEKYYREMVKDKLKPLPGAIELIKSLNDNNFNLAVGSSGPPENVKLLLKSLNIKKYFSVIVTAADIKKGKPEPDVFLFASERLNLSPKNCLVIEDAPVGIKAAKKAGMKVIALTTTHDEQELLEADKIIMDLSYITINDIVEILQSEIIK
ncbi:MAG: HAD family hydrolase [Candidatus Hodarchaeota archaeon]